MVLLSTSVSLNINDWNGDADDTGPSSWDYHAAFLKVPDLSSIVRTEFNFTFSISH